MKTLITLDSGKIATKIDHKIILNHLIAITHLVQIDRIITLEEVHLNINDKKNQVQNKNETTPDQPVIDNTKTLEKQLNHTHCESTVDGSENEAH